MRVLATYNRRLPPRPLPVPANARRRRRGSSTRGRCRAATSVVCHAGHGTLVRALSCGCRGRRLPGRGRHERERRARGLGRRRRAPAAAVRLARARCGWRSSGRWRSRRSGRGRGSSRRGAPGTIRPRAAAELVEALAARGQTAPRAGGGGIIGSVEDAVARYCVSGRSQRHGRAGRDARARGRASLAADRQGRFQGARRRDGSARGAIYGMLRDVRWEPPVGDGPPATRGCGRARRGRCRSATRWSSSSARTGGSSGSGRIFGRCWR